MSMCRVFSCVVGRGCLLWPVPFLGKTLLAFALLHSVFQGQICLLLQKISQSNYTRTTALSNSMKLSHARGATQDGRVMVESSDRMWSTGEGNDKPLLQTDKNVAIHYFGPLQGLICFGFMIFTFSKGFIFLWYIWHPHCSQINIKWKASLATSSPAYQNSAV